jgi:hypothetical protein
MASYSSQWDRMGIMCETAGELLCPAAFRLETIAQSEAQNL